MKTVKEWLSELPEPVRTAALNNLERYPIDGDKFTDNMGEALIISFLWENTVEGYDYWDKICERYEMEEKC